MLVQTSAFIATAAELLVVDLASGDVTATLLPERDLSPGAEAVFAPPPPVLIDLAGTVVIAVAFAVTVPGEGTTPAEDRVEILLVDPARSAVVRTLDVPLAPGNPSPAASDLPAIAGAGDGTLVLGYNGNAYGIDLATGAIGWETAGVWPRLVSGTTVVGIAHTDSGVRMNAAALDLADGRELWVDDQDSVELRVVPAGPGQVVLAGSDYGDLSGYYRFVDPTTGEVTGASVRDLTGGSVTCGYDLESITVCHQADSWIGAFDADGELLWELPDQAANRVAVSVTAVWHGAVYGTTENGPVVLDAATGADGENPPGVAPFLVNEYVGLAHPDQVSGPSAYPAVG